MTWSLRRQITYFIVFASIVLLLIGIPVFALLHKTPTCSDGKKNGTEQDVDCGGICTRLCIAQELEPKLQWQQSFEIQPGVYNAVAYIQNLNPDAQAKDVPYVFILKDKNGQVVAVREGKASIPPGINFAIFEGTINVPKGLGDLTTTFTFTGQPDWMRVKTPVHLLVKNQQIFDVTTAPIVMADIENPTLTQLGRVNATAIIYDTEGNPISASKTYVDRIGREASEKVAFTWPTTFPGQLTACQQPTDVMLDIDRSGSMTSDSKKPPQPLTAVKNAALTFVDALGEMDKVGLVSFATEATNPIDQILTDNHKLVKDAIGIVSIATNGTQYTNIYDALQRSITELMSARHRDGAKPAIVLLTDGNPTYPIKKGNTNYAAEQAIAAAHDAESKGIDIYTIGLGNEVDENFLKSISGVSDRYYKASTSTDLTSVYSAIGAALCKLGPAKIEIIPEIEQ